MSMHDRAMHGGGVYFLSGSVQKWLSWHGTDQMLANATYRFDAARKYSNTKVCLGLATHNPMRVAS